MVTSTTSTEVQSPQGLVQRVQTLAQKEAQAARERRGLPFGGLFGPAESNVVGLLPTDHATRSGWASFLPF